MALLNSSTFATAVVSRRGKANREVLSERHPTAPFASPGQHLVQALIISVTMAAFCAGCSQTQVAPPSVGKGQAPLDGSTEVKEAYEKFWDVGNAVIKQDPAQWSSQLAEIAVDPQLSRMLGNLKTLASRSLTVYGGTREHVTKIEVAGDGATVQDCQDASGSGQADAKSGERKTVGIPRNPVTAHLRLGADRKWRVAEISYPGGTC
jgi:hypothetical protein